MIVNKHNLVSDFLNYQKIIINPNHFFNLKQMNSFAICIGLVCLDYC